MRLVTLSFENYKPFNERIDLELKPMTIILGRNGAGKSALLQLAPLLLESLTNRIEPGLPMKSGEQQFAKAFPDLVHNKHIHGHIVVGAMFEHNGETWSFETIIQSMNLLKQEQQKQVVTYFQSKTNGTVDIEIVWSPKASKEKGVPCYNKNNSQIVEEVQFQGLLPDLSEVDKIWRNRLKDYHHEMVYIGPIRQHGERYFEIAEESLRQVGYRGQFASALLEQKREALLDPVKKWYSRDELGNRKLDILQSGPIFEILLKKEDAPIHINDVGQGMAQAFPIVVQRSLASSPDRLEIVEEPESHLHTSAHGAIADLFLPKGSVSEQLIVETHSEIFLLRLRRAIAEGRLCNKDVALFWIDDEDSASTIQEIHIDESGDVDDWPSQLFSENYEEALKLRQAQRRLEKRSDH